MIKIDFEQELDEQLNKLPYTKHLDDGQYNDGVLAGFEMGARWCYDKIENNLNKNIGEFSDGYHTFNELYEHRFSLFIALCKELLYNSRYQTGWSANIWKSLKHSDNTNYEGWFIMGIGKQKGEQISYHLPLKYWDKTNFATVLEKAPEFDGHSSNDVLIRINKL
jgi:hypothetical protein